MSGLLTEGPDLAGSPALVRRPGRKRTVLLPLLLLLTVGGWFQFAQPAIPSLPPTINGYFLAGPRGPVCLRMIIGMDVSGSMTDFATARDRALTELLAWSRQPDILRDTDEIAVVDFAFEAAARLTPGPVRSSPSVPGATIVDGTDTLLRPLLDTIAGFPATTCDSVLILLSDAQIADLPVTAGDGDDLLRKHGLHDIRLLVPGAGIAVPGEWSRAFPTAAPIILEDTDPDSTAIAIGYTVGDLTRQQFVPRPPPPTP